MNTDAIFWFRRDLRLDDNCGLYHALKEHKAVQGIFIFDTEILDKLEDKRDKRVSLLYDMLQDLHAALEKEGGSLKVYYGKPTALFKEEILSDFPEVKAVHTNHDYEPYAKERDQQVQQVLEEQNISFHTYKDQVIFEKDEVVKADGGPYTVFTPYFNTWKKRLEKEGIPHWDTKEVLGNVAKAEHAMLPFDAMPFEYVAVDLPNKQFAAEGMQAYGDQRDYPAKKGTSRLSVHLRFGSISIRQLAKKAWDNTAETYLSELAWRDFYHQILYHYPKVKDSAFKDRYERVPWRNNEEDFKAWCEGKTGVPIVDAGMRELNKTGYMHNRVRMIVASFLTKNLLIDWRWGERYFAKKLLDYDMAANTGGWQWAAGCGTDAAPYFRVFNPITQAEKYDPKGVYIRKWVPEFDQLSYPQPIVDVKESRKRAIATYKEALN